MASSSAHSRAIVLLIILAVDAYAHLGGKTMLSRCVVEATRKWPLMHSPSVTGFSSAESRLPVGCPHRSAQEKAGGRAAGAESEKA